MKQSHFSLIIMLSLGLSTGALAAEDERDFHKIKEDKLYFRCESQNMDFNESSEMNQVSPGRFAITIPSNRIKNKDRCVLSIVDSSSQGELNFLDFVPSANDETVKIGTAYELLTSSNRPSFGVAFEKTADYLVEFDIKDRKLQLKVITSTKNTRIIATRS